MSNINMVHDITPLNKLKIISSSWILKEPIFSKLSTTKRGINELKSLYLFPEDINKSDLQLFRELVINAIDTDFLNVINFMIEISDELSDIPQCILIELAIHPRRASFNISNPCIFKEAANKIIKSPINLLTQLGYFNIINHNKLYILPNIIKTIWSNYLIKTKSEELKMYLRKKYYNVNIIDVIRLSHANPKKNQGIKDLLGEIKVTQTRSTSNTENKKEDTDPIECYIKYCQAIKQTCFQETVDNLYSNMQISINQLPKLIGNTICLCDNSGSSYSGFKNINGYIKMGKMMNFIGFLSSVKSSERGTIGLFGNKLLLYEVYNKTNNVIDEFKKFSDLTMTKNCRVGDSSENGLWLFFEQAFKDPENYMVQIQVNIKIISGKIVNVLM